MSACSSILVGCLGSVAWARIEGRATQESCGNVKRFLRDQFDEGFREFVIDLQGCNGIDSTFIGMLYRLACDVDDKGENGNVEVINPGERNTKAICKLGLDRKIKIDRDGSSWAKEQELIKENLQNPLRCDTLDKRERAEMILDAHEALSAANDENKNRFCDVLDYLRKDIESQEDDDRIGTF